ncbi:hypothetical protein MTO96_003547 [Rhipicephalus appendiculatus]
MKMFVLSALLVVLSTSGAKCESIPVNDTSALTKTIEIMDVLVGMYSTLDIPVQDCITAKLTEFRSDEHKAVYVVHLKTLFGGIDTPPFCIDLTVSATGEFRLGLCGPRVLYFDGQGCMVTSLVLFAQRQCLMGVKPEYKDNVPEECVNQFDQQCGSKKRLLYDKDQCT